MDYTYKDREIEFARYIKANPPNKIWWDYTTYIFDYGNKYYQIESVSEVADTQNKSDEAIIGKFSKHLKPFVPSENAILVCQDKSIEELYIVRVFLYFTTYRKYSSAEKQYNRTKQKLKSLLSGKKDLVGDLISRTIGSCEEVTCHPKSEEAKKVKTKYSNLVDCGLLLYIDGKCLKTFVENNGFGFQIWDDKYFFDVEELKDIPKQYELIKI